MKYPYFLFFLLVLAIPSAAKALSSDWQKDDAMAVRLIAGVDGVGQETVLPLALDIQLAPDWHSYWRSPGEAGLPPELDWKNSLNEEDNLDSVKFVYPAPKRYIAFGLETIGYRDHIVFPIDAQLRTPGRPLKAETSLNILVCSSVCVPKTFTLKLTIPLGPAVESTEAALIKEFKDKVPADAAKSGFVIQSLVNTGHDLSLILTSRDPLSAPDLFVESSDNIAFSSPVAEVSPDQHSVEFKLRPLDQHLKTGSSLTLTIVDNSNALETSIKIPPITAPPLLAPPSHLSLWLATLLAILGGFILNLMPCVLPVLSLKFMSVISHGGGNKNLVRKSFLMTAGGILFSFIVLATMTILLKYLGLSFGWGVQFQQPFFIIGLVILLTFFATNMWGFLDIPLPRFLADTLTGPYHPKLAGDFAAGAFATLLATPCTAPFLGTAIGFALASNAVSDIYVIFCALGFGMTLPYLVVALYPRCATALPKPGAWMATLKHFLGWALAMTALWLIWVLAAQITSFFAFLVGICMAAIILMIAARRVSYLRRSVPYGAGLFAFLALLIVLIGSNLPKQAVVSNQQWVAFDEKAIALDIAEGNTVFVDVTADWCLTCKANKKFILSQDQLSQKLFHSNIIAMQADWTNPDPVITAFLQKYQRYGIPFNIVFGPGAPQGIVLPELLSTDIVLQALDKASTHSAP